MLEVAHICAHTPHTLPSICVHIVVSSHTFLLNSGPSKMAALLWIYLDKFKTTRERNAEKKSKEQKRVTVTARNYEEGVELKLLLPAD